MWKGAAVVAGRCGGLKHQIEDGVNGFLVSSPEETADCIERLLNDDKLRKGVGTRAQKTVRQRFLLSRLIEQYLDLAGAFEPQFAVNQQQLTALSLAALSESAVERR
jgi:trehalose synthase